MSAIPNLNTLPAAPSLISPGMLREPILQDDHRQRFDRHNMLLLLEGIRPDALFIGDSLTADWPVESLFADCFPVVVNRAFGGDAVRYLPLRLEADAIQLQPHNVFFMIGTNDIAFRFDYDNDDTIVADMLGHYHTCFTRLRDAGIRTYVGTIPPMRRMLVEDALYARKSVLIPRINAALTEIAGEYGFTLIDYYFALLDAEGMLAARLTTDGTHFTAAGYYRMNRLVRQTLAG